MKIGVQSAILNRMFSRDFNNKVPFEQRTEVEHPKLNA